MPGFTFAPKKALLEAPDLVSFTENALSRIYSMFPLSFAMVEFRDRRIGPWNGRYYLWLHGDVRFERIRPDRIRSSAPGYEKRIANKKLCPCGCRLRLGRCPLHHRLNIIRPAAPRSWFSKHRSDVETRRFGWSTGNWNRASSGVFLCRSLSKIV